MPKGSRSRGVFFAAIVAVSLSVAAGYVAWAALRGDSSPALAGSGRASAIRSAPHVVFQNVGGRAGDRQYAHVALAPLDDPTLTRAGTRLVCERVYFAADRGLCLASQHGLLQNAYEARITGPDFKPVRELQLAGIPSRARISPDGRYGATTSFVTGHSYADADFSTQTVVIDMQRGKVVADLEKDFTVTRDGKAIKEADFNFWGVTFTRRPGIFYATLRTGDTTYLLEGDLRTRRARVLHENVECPSVSPDSTRVAYKKWLGDRWRLYVLNLATMKETPLADERPVDDQVEWLDNEHVLYGLGDGHLDRQRRWDRCAGEVPFQRPVAGSHPELTARRAKLLVPAVVLVTLALAGATVVVSSGSEDSNGPQHDSQSPSSEVPITRSDNSNIYVTDAGGSAAGPAHEGQRHVRAGSLMVGHGRDRVQPGSSERLRAAVCRERRRWHNARGANATDASVRPHLVARRAQDRLRASWEGDLCSGSANRRRTQAARHGRVRRRAGVVSRWEGDRLRTPGEVHELGPLSHQPLGPRPRSD